MTMTFAAKSFTATRRAFAAVQVGILRALVAHGIVPDLVAGSSVGAINGAYFAGAPDARGVAQLEAIWRDLRRSEVFPLTWRSLLGLLTHRWLDGGGLTRQRVPGALRGHTH